MNDSRTAFSGVAGQFQLPAWSSLGKASGRFSSVKTLWWRLPGPAGDAFPRRTPFCRYHGRSGGRSRKGFWVGNACPDRFFVTRGHAPPEPGLTCFAHGGTGGATGRDGTFQIMSGRQRMGSRAGDGRGGAGRAGTSWHSHRRDNRWPVCPGASAPPPRPAADPAPGHTAPWPRR